MSAEVFVHERALCESDDVGAGTRVWAFAHVMPGARVGRDCNVCGHSFIESGAVVGDRVTVKNNVVIWDAVTVGDDVFLGPGVVFTNDRNPRAAVRKGPGQFVPTTVERGATVGANATVLCGVTIGEAAFVAAGSVVLADVAPRALVAGNPARPIGHMCDCGERLGVTAACAACGRRFEARDDGGLTLVGTGQAQ